MPESLVIGEVDLMSERASKASRPKGVDFFSTVVGAPEEPSHSPAQAPSSYRPVRDSTWLQVDVCRDYQRDTCPRGFSCRFAHPRSRIVLVKDGKVTCCYDYLKVPSRVHHSLFILNVPYCVGSMSETSMQVLPSSCSYQGEASVCR